MEAEGYQFEIFSSPQLKGMNTSSSRSLLQGNLIESLNKFKVCCFLLVNVSINVL